MGTPQQREEVRRTKTVHGVRYWPVRGDDQTKVSVGADDSREQSRNEDSEDDMVGHNLTDEGQDPPKTDLGGVAIPEVDTGDHADSEEKPERRYPQGLHEHPNT